MILAPLGSGGMGVVHMAFDPELDRKVAIKFLRPELGDISAEAEGRLLREARAMARLTHPNVATVYDVGAAFGRIFVAMELFDGGTLAHWIREQPRATREILEHFEKAGAGLRAAHEKGLVHRDFKPDNVLLGRDGRVCVTDFGLVHARVFDGELEHDGRAHDPVVTENGVRFGTPAYMSPEQHRGMPTDARSDQFSFCVALYEALYGERPFRGSTPRELLAAIEAGPTALPAKARDGRNLSAKVRDSLRRGLSANREDRHPHMAELLQSLAPASSRTRKMTAFALFAAAASTVFAFARMTSTPARAPACSGMEAALANVWDPSVKERVRASFEATKKSYAGAAFQQLDRELDAYARDWIASRTDTCRATRIRGDQPDSVHALRTLCLDRRLGELRALTEVLATANARVVEQASSAAGHLVPIATCNDTVLLASSSKAPPDPASRAAIASLEAKLDVVKAFGDAGRYRDALERVRPLAEEAKAVGFRPLTARIALRRGVLELAVTDLAHAQASLLDALWHAEASGAEETTLEAWSVLGRAYVLEGKIEPAYGALAREEAALERVGHPIQFHDGWVEAKAMVALLAGKASESVSLWREHLAALEKRLGPNDPELTLSLGQLGHALVYVGGFDESAAVLERSVAILTRALGPEHPRTAAAMQRLGETYDALGRLEEAETLLRGSLALQEKAFGPEHTVIVFSLLHLGSVVDQRGRTDEGFALVRRGLAIEEKTFGPKHLAVAFSRMALAELALRHGLFAEARTVMTPALAIWEASIGPDHFETVDAMVLLARAELALGDKAAAPRLQKAIAYYDAHPAPAVKSAEARFAFAHLPGLTPLEARSWATRARDGFSAAGPGARARKEAVEAFLSKMRTP
ncbi:protein kinase domain-containing protein [Pendulispora albinea]|uniref:Serine/threonine-protein kinase n=1 Tax=Pendulispora albinea TaxID=2741071 RepID=A0ABZ2MB35_9BACT